MSSSNLQHAVRSLLCSTVIAGTLAIAGGAAASAAGADCPGLDVAPTATNTAEIRASILCLTNAERSLRGLTALRENARLRSAASAHSSDMVRNGFFAHTAPDGDTFVDRILSAGYTKRTSSWSLAENLAWGTGDVGTPRGVHDAWMRSSGHKATILTADYRELGIGARPGVPENADVGATYTTDFGVRGSHR